MKSRISAALFIMTLVLGGMTVQAEEAADQPAAEEALTQIGEDDGEADYHVVLKNETGEEITAIALRVNYKDFSDNLLLEGEPLADQKSGELICPDMEMVNFVPPVYDLQLTFADGSVQTLHTLPIGDADEISVRLGEAVTEGETEGEEAAADAQKVAYISFTSLSLQYETDTLRRESEIAQIGEQVLIADYEAKVAGGGAPAGDGGGAGADAGGGSAPAPEQCLDNGLVF